MNFIPRPAQQRVIDFECGRMGVSAVPGSGKTQTLSYLASQILSRNSMADGQEILIVTLVNSAVDNFEQRIQQFTRKRGLFPSMGYRVRTLHGLAHDIVRERRDLAGLSDQFSILDEQDSNEIIKSTTQAWLRANPDFLLDWTDPAVDLTRDSKVIQAWPDLLVDLAYSFIKQAKDLQATPVDIRARLEQLRSPQPLLEMGCQIYADYQRALNYRSAVDFDDLIRLALQALESDSSFLERLRYRWPFILEDEAQDSSRLQEKILRLLVGESGSWVRVGDPNQAIYETFTTASPRYLREFMTEPGVTPRELPNSGRSTKSIIRLANHLIEWTRARHPVDELRESLVLPLVLPTEDPKDPQPNPQDHPDAIYLGDTKLAPDKEILAVVQSLKRWLPDHKDDTAAVLVTRNERGAQIANSLRKEGLPVVELLRSSSPTRETADMLATILRCLAEPTSAAWLSRVYKAIYHKQASDPAAETALNRIVRMLSQIARVETLLRPESDEENWLLLQPEDLIDPLLRVRLQDFTAMINRWQEATLLPVDQLLLILAQDLFTEPTELALAYKLARAMENTAQSHPSWRLPEFAQELEAIVRNKRKMLGFTEEDNGFDPDAHKGKVVVTTVHKAKGLEWDRVYLISVNNYDYPSCQPQDTFIGEKWFVRDHLNLQAEILARLSALIEEDIAGLYLPDGEATRESRLLYAAERLRLLYVGITRARKELLITWNTGRNGDCTPALPLVALQAFWETRTDASAA